VITKRLHLLRYARNYISHYADSESKRLVVKLRNVHFIFLLVFLA